MCKATLALGFLRKTTNKHENVISEYTMLIYSVREANGNQGS